MKFGKVRELVQGCKDRALAQPVPAKESARRFLLKHISELEKPRHNSARRSSPA